jgi:hypothetical protein
MVFRISFRKEVISDGYDTFLFGSVFHFNDMKGCNDGFRVFRFDPDLALPTSLPEGSGKDKT